MFAVVHFPPRTENSGDREKDIDKGFLVSVANNFSPFYEIVDDRTVAINVRGLGLLYPGGKEEICGAIRRYAENRAENLNIAFGNSLAQTIITAICLPGDTLVSSDERLKDISLLNLRLPPKYVEIFTEWGIKTVKDLLILKPSELISRLGGEINFYLENLTGKSSFRPLNPPPAARKFKKKVNLDDPVEDLAACLYLLEVKLGELTSEVSRYALAAAEIIVYAFAGGGTFHSIHLKLPIPSLNLKYLVKLLSYELEKHRPGTELVRNLEIEIISAEPRRTQLSFWKPPSPDPENLELTLAKLKKMLGSENVGIPVIKDSYNPLDFEIDGKIRPASSEFSPVAEKPNNGLKNLFVFRYFLEPVQVNFIKSLDHPYFLEIENQRSKIRLVSEPWLSSGKWWDSGCWVRREFDVEIESGQVLRVVEAEDGGFFAEGYYD